MENKERTDLITSEQTDFKREISLFGGVSIIGGIMIGSGIFLIGSYVLYYTKMSEGFSLLAWIIGGIVSLLGGLCFAEMGAAMPRAGGMLFYLNEAYHPMVGFLDGFSAFFLTCPGSNAGLAIMIPTILKTFIPGMTNLEMKLIAIAVIILLTIYNILGIRQGMILQNWSMAIKLIPIFIIMIASLILGKETPNLTLAPTAGTPTNFSAVFSMIALGIVASLWAYEGWTNLNTVAEEIKNPRKNLPLALIITIGGITLLYTLFNYSIFRVLPLDKMQQLMDAGNWTFGAEAAKATLGNAGGILVSISMLICVFNSLNGCIIAFPRAFYAMSKEGHFFPAFKELHPKYKTPYWAMIAQCVLSIVLLLLRDLKDLTQLVVFNGMVFNLLTVIAVIVMRKKYPNINRPFKMWGYPYTVILTAILFAGLVVNSLLSKESRINALYGIGVIIIGVFCYFIFDKMMKKEKTEQK